MATRLTVSVALCTHNGEKFLEEQLRSVLNQTAPPREIVVSDDTSTDGTVALVQATVAAHRTAHPEHDLTVRLLQNSAPLGVAKNFEQAILACTGDLVALCDQDDIWVPDKLQRMSALFEKRPDLVLLHTDARLIDEAGMLLPGTLFSALEVSAKSLSAIHAGRAFDVLLRRNVITGATTVVRRSFATTVVPFPDAWVHDEWLAMAASVLGEMDVLEDTLIEYRQHGTNQIGVSKLSVLGKFHRMVEPGGLRNRRLLTRATALAHRFETIDERIPYRQVAAVRAKLRHEQVRASLPRIRLARLAPILRELFTGRYATFGRGASDAVRDLLQPLEASR
jgi:glycosyltransferase involved in cell wall biosynthesis